MGEPDTVIDCWCALLVRVGTLIKWWAELDQFPFLDAVDGRSRGTTSVVTGPVRSHTTLFGPRPAAQAVNGTPPYVAAQKARSPTRAIEAFVDCNHAEGSDHTRPTSRADKKDGRKGSSWKLLVASQGRAQTCTRRCTRLNQFHASLKSVENNRNRTIRSAASPRPLRVCRLRPPRQQSCFAPPAPTRSAIHNAPRHQHRHPHQATNILHREQRRSPPNLPGSPSQLAVLLAKPGTKLSSVLLGRLRG